MKRFLTIITLALVFPIVSFAYTSPGKPQGFVNDFAHVLSGSEQQNLEQKLTQFEKDTSNEITVVTVPTIGDDTIEDYAVSLFKEWGIGKETHDNGVLLLIAVNDHLTRIEVGYGLEGAITDALSNSIIQNSLIPAFQKDDFYGGIDAATDNLMQASEGEYTPESSGGSGIKVTSGLIFIIFYAVLWLASVLARSRSWWAGGVVGGILAVVIGFFTHIFFYGALSFILLVPFGLLFDFLISRSYANRVATGNSRFPWWMGGGGPGGFGGGGFGGFGGGSSGGGGASGKW